MGEKRDALAKIVSFVTGIPEEKLEEFEPLRALLEKADNPGEVEERFDFGLYTFIWPSKYPWPYKGGPVLAISSCESKRPEIADLKALYWPAWYEFPKEEKSIYPPFGNPVFAVFCLKEDNLERVRKRLLLSRFSR